MGRPLTAVLLGAVLVTAAACAPVDTETVTLVSPVGGGGSGTIQARSDSGVETFARRVDGTVDSIYRDAVTSDEEQIVVLTGLGGGSAQSSLLVLSLSGELLARHRVSGDVPPLRPGGERRYRFVAPAVARALSFDYGGRRLVVVPTRGTWAPYSIEVLEAEDERALTPRYRFWNLGMPGTPVVDPEGGLMAFHAINNSYSTEEPAGVVYPTTLTVVSLDEALASPADDGVLEGVCPLAANANSPETAGHGYLRYYLLPEFEGGGHHASLVVSVEGRTVRASTASGLTYVVDVDGDEVRIVPSDSFRARHRRERDSDPTLPALEDWLAGRAARVRSFRPAAD